MLTSGTWGVDSVIGETKQFMNDASIHNYMSYRNKMHKI